jgi:hypothetical protein
MPLPSGFSEGAFRLMLKQRVQEALNPVFKRISEMVTNLADPLNAPDVRKEVLKMIEQVLDEIMNEMKARAEKPDRRIRFGYPAERLE